VRCIPRPPASAGSDCRSASLPTPPRYHHCKQFTWDVTACVRFAFGPVAVITPFNFPLEIPALQVMGAVYMGNKPVLKVCACAFVCACVWAALTGMASWYWRAAVVTCISMLAFMLSLLP
jgi:acyl-CoA reductase-like NAD-dependent aldehyde dehydrogenase